MPPQFRLTGDIGASSSLPATSAATAAFGPWGGIVGGILGLAGLFGDQRDWTDYYGGDFTAQTNLNLKTPGAEYFRPEMAFAKAQEMMGAGYYTPAKNMLEASRLSEERLLRQAAGEAQPTMATFRGYAASQGVPSGISNPIAMTQSTAATKRTQELISRGNQEIGSRYAKSLVDVLGQAQSLATQYWQTGFGAQTQGLQMGLEADWKQKLFAGEWANRAGMFNLQRKDQAMAAASGYQSPWTTTGFGMLGEWLGGLG